MTEDGLVAQPQQRRLADPLVAEDLRALLGDQEFGAVAADTPAVEFAMLLGYDLVGSHCVRLIDCQWALDPGTCNEFTARVAQRRGTERVRPLPSMATKTNAASVTLRHSLDNGSSLHTSTIIWIELRPISRVWV